MEPRPPHERGATLRQEIIRALSQGCALTLRDISQEVRASEKEIASHLDHIRISLRAQGRELLITPSECRSCGFVFKARRRIAKPGRCPECDATNISPPEFSISTDP